MTINDQREDTALTMEIEGRIDTQTAPQLQKTIEDSLDGVTTLVLDFTKVGYISSSGLRTLLTAQNWMEGRQGEMIIRGAGKSIVDIIKVTGFDSFLTLE